MQLHPPTAVTHCTAAWLTHAAPQQQQEQQQQPGAATNGGTEQLPDLVVVRSTQLELYAVRPAVATPSSPPAAAAPPPPPSSTTAAVAAAGGLELVASTHLFGVVESMAVLRARAPGQRDALLLTFRSARWRCLAPPPAGAPPPLQSRAGIRRMSALQCKPTCAET